MKGIGCKINKDFFLLLTGVGMIVLSNQKMFLKRRQNKLYELLNRLRNGGMDECRLLTPLPFSIIG